MHKILIADDEENIVNMLKYAISKEGYIVETAYDGYEASEKIKSFKPDVLLLDVMMPYRDGYQVCKEFAGKCAIILLTAKSDITDKIAGIELGADDYITKPFDIREVIIRIKALIRRTAKYDLKTIDTGSLSVIQEQRQVLLYGQEIEMTPIEYNLLLLLVQNINRVFTREELMDKVWGYEYYGENRSVDIQIQRIRKKLGAAGNRIKTIYGVGYKLTGEYVDENKE